LNYEEFFITLNSEPKTLRIYEEVYFYFIAIMSVFVERVGSKQF